VERMQAGRRTDLVSIEAARTAAPGALPTQATKQRIVHVAKCQSWVGATAMQTWPPIRFRPRSCKVRSRPLTQPENALRRAGDRLAELEPLAQ